HTLSPDKLAQTKKPATVEGVMTKRVLTEGNQTLELTEGNQTLELYVQPIAGHNDSMILAYLPKQKILVEVDAWTPAAANAPAATTPPNPFTVELYNEVQQLKLDVKQ